MKKKERKTVKLNTPVFRVSFPSLFEPSSYQGGDPKYQVTCLVPKNFDGSGYPDPKGNNEKRMNAIHKAIEVVGNEYFGDKWAKVKLKQKGRSHWPIRDGGERDTAGYGPEVEFFCPKANAKSKPSVVIRKNGKYLPLGEEDLYPGCYAVASITVYPSDYGNGGVFLALNNVLKVADGESFGGRSSPESDFEEWDDEDESMDDDF